MAALQEGCCLQHLQLQITLRVLPKQGERASGENGDKGVGVGQARDCLSIAQAAVEKQPRRGRPHVGDLRQRYYLLLHSRQRAGLRTTSKEVQHQGCNTKQIMGSCGV